MKLAGSFKCNHCLLSCNEQQLSLANGIPCSRCALVRGNEVDRPRPLLSPLRLSLSSWAHQSHPKLRHRRGVVWCGRCGAYATSARARLLLQPCAGPSAKGKEVVSRVQRGLTPTTQTAWQW